jgi:hypothetical protein
MTGRCETVSEIRVLPGAGTMLANVDYEERALLQRGRGVILRWRAAHAALLWTRPAARRVVQARRAVTLHRGVGGLPLARSLAVLGRVLGYAMRHEEAADAASKAIELAQGDDVVLGWALLAQADAFHALGRDEPGYAAAQSSAASFQRRRRHVE